MKVPQQIFLNFMFFGSLYPKISYATGISSGISNQSYWRFWSTVLCFVMKSGVDSALRREGKWWEMARNKMFERIGQNMWKYLYHQEVISASLTPPRPNAREESKQMIWSRKKWLSVTSSARSGMARNGCHKLSRLKSPTPNITAEPNGA